MPRTKRAASHAAGHMPARVMLSGDMGRSDVFDRAITDFSMTYADRNEKDRSAPDRTVRSGTSEAVVDEAQ